MKRYFWQKIVGKEKIYTSIFISTGEEYKVKAGEEILFSKEISREEAIKICGEDAINAMEEIEK